jgi:hypothetical protein
LSGIADRVGVARTMIRIRLLRSFRDHHHELPAGLVMGLDDLDLVGRLVRLDEAEFVDRQTAVIGPSETRSDPEFSGTVDYPIIKPHRPRGRPKKIVEVADGD